MSAATSSPREKSDRCGLPLAWGCAYGATLIGGFSLAARWASGPTFGAIIGGLAGLAIALPAVTLMPDYGEKYPAEPSAPLTPSPGTPAFGSEAQARRGEGKTARRLGHPIAPRALSAAAATFAVLLVWWLTLPRAVFPVGPMLAVSFATISFAAAIAALCIALAESRIHRAAAAAIVVTIACAWLTWPIWLARGLTGAEASLLARLNPALVANGLFTNTPTWPEEPIAYRYLTVLNQDVPCPLPDSAGQCIAVHAGFAVFCLGWIWLARRRRGRPGQFAGAAESASDDALRDGTSS